jgi:hypothetical protein
MVLLHTVSPKLKSLLWPNAKKGKANLNFCSLETYKVVRGFWEWFEYVLIMWASCWSSVQTYKNETVMFILFELAIMEKCSRIK